MQDIWNDEGETISKTFRVELVVCTCGCNGQKTGPTIEATVGETVIVTLVNRMAEPTSMDVAGAGVLVSPAGHVPPGESREYQFLLVNSGRFSYGWGELVVFPD